jgi:SAM-dependent methyltransferase
MGHAPSVALKPPVKFLATYVLAALPSSLRKKFKEYWGLRYWRNLIEPIRDNQSQLTHERSHYAHFFTTHFGLSEADYTGKTVLDIGCGPMGSLEWATMAKERVGLDPLADAYRKLIGSRHAMTYRTGTSEAILYPGGHFDVVTSFNNLDHVEDVGRTIPEMKRVTAPRGKILLIVEVGHDVTPTEPHKIDRSIIERFAPEFRPMQVDVFATRHDHNIYASIRDRLLYVEDAPGVLCVKFECSRMGLPSSVIPANHFDVAVGCTGQFFDK